MANKIFTFKHSVYFNETNSMGGVVYFANYVKWQGMVREEFFIRAVSNWKDIMNEVISGRVNMVTMEEHSQFIHHAFFGDEIEIKIHASEIRKLSFKILFEMTKNGDKNIIYKGWQKLAFDDYRGNFIAIPESLLRAVLEHTSDEEILKYNTLYPKTTESIHQA